MKTLKSFLNETENSRKGLKRESLLEKSLMIRQKTTVTATNETIKDIVSEAISQKGYDVDLNYIDVSQVTNMKNLFYGKMFNGDIRQWDVSNVTDMS